MMKLLLFLSCTISLSSFSQIEIRTEIRSIDSDELISLYTTGYGKSGEEVYFNQEFGVEEIRVIKLIQDSVVYKNDTLKVQISEVSFSNGEFTKDSLIVLKGNNEISIKREYKVEQWNGEVKRRLKKEGHYKKGNLITEIYFTDRKKMKLPVVEKKVEYVYKNNLLIEEKTYYFIKNSFRLNSTVRYSYNASFLLENSEFIYEGETEKKLTYYKYDSLGRLVEEKMLFNQEEVLSSFRFSDSEYGHEKESRTFRNGRLTSITKEIFNWNGILISEEKYLIDDKSKFKIYNDKRFFDSTGNQLSKRIIYDFYSNNIETLTYTYQ